MCSICTEDIQSNQAIKKLKCNHKFHAECFDIWGNNGSDYVSCPLCRRRYKKKHKYYNPPHFVIVRDEERQRKDASFQFGWVYIIAILIGIIILMITEWYDGRKINFRAILTIIIVSMIVPAGERIYHFVKNRMQ